MVHLEIVRGLKSKTWIAFCIHLEKYDFVNANKYGIYFQSVNILFQMCIKYGLIKESRILIGWNHWIHDDLYILV